MVSDSGRTGAACSHQRSGCAISVSLGSWHQSTCSQPKPVSQVGSTALNSPQRLPSSSFQTFSSVGEGPCPSCSSLNLHPRIGSGPWQLLNKCLQCDLMRECQTEAQRGQALHWDTQQGKAVAGAGSRPGLCPQSQVPPLLVSPTGTQLFRTSRDTPAAHHLERAPAAGFS